MRGEMKRNGSQAIRSLLMACVLAFMLSASVCETQPVPVFADRTAELGLELQNAAACWALRGRSGLEEQRWRELHPDHRRRWGCGGRGLR